MNNLDTQVKSIFELKMKNSKEQNSTDKFKSISLLNNSEKIRYLSNTAQNFNRISQLTSKNRFKGFFNKKFSLTKYKKSREKSMLLSHSLEKIIKPHKLRGNGIPTDILERIKLLKNIFYSEKFKNYYDKRPKHRELTFEEISEYIINFRKKNSELESAMMAFYFICHEIKYLKNSKDITPKNLKSSQKPENVFQAKRALSMGFTNFYEYLLKKMEIKFKHIEGYCKLIPKSNSKFMINQSPNLYVNTTNISNLKDKDQIPNSFIINHCWNSIYINREWYLVDLLLGSGGINLIDLRSHIYQEDGKSTYFDFNFNPYYFMPPPEHFILTHRPTEDLWQFTNKTITLKQFINSGFEDLSTFYKGIYLNNIEFLSHNNPYIKISSKDNLVIKLRVKNSLLGGDLYSSNGQIKISEIKYSYDESTQIYTFEPSFPSNGDFILKMNSRSMTSTDLLYWPLVNYFVKVQDRINFSYFEKYKLRMRTITGAKNSEKDIILPKLNHTISNNFYQPKIISDYLKIFPSRLNKKICYDNEGFSLIEPRVLYLKKGTNVKFKVRMKGAANMAILDGNKLFHLKKTERNVYEGEKVIKDDNVSICCLRGKNIFTEVYRFKQFKEKSVDSKMFMMKIKKRKIL